MQGTRAVAPLESTTRDELLDLARALAQDTARRYAALAARLEALGQPEDAATLRRETEHQGQDEPPAAAQDAARRDRVLAELGWRLPEMPSPVTLYRALAWATETAEARFKLFGALGGRLRAGGARALCDELAQAALSEAARLRRARRRAYRAERDAGGPDLAAAAREVRSSDELRLAAREIETCVAGHLAAMADTRAERALGLTEEILRSLGGKAEERTAPGARSGRPFAVHALDQAFAFYDLVQARATDEAVMVEAQRLADRTVERLRQLEASPS